MDLLLFILITGVGLGLYTHVLRSERHVKDMLSREQGRSREDIERLGGKLLSMDEKYCDWLSLLNDHNQELQKEVNELKGGFQ